MSNPTLAIGTTVALHYRILRPIDVGGYSSVYEAARDGVAAPVALKILHTRLGASETKVRRFEREVTLLQRLQHPNVVRMLDFGQTIDGLPYISFELLRGRSLRDDLDQRGALAPTAAGSIARQVLLALQTAHGMGIVHRDIKPANIYLCNLDGAAPDVKLLDLGIAKALSDEQSQGSKLTATGDMLGSPHYMAPEQAHGRQIDERVDLYSLGLVLAEMLSGQKVVAGESNVEIAMKHVAPQPHVLPDEVLRSAFAPVITRAVAKARDERYDSAAAMLAELDAAAPPDASTTAPKGTELLAASVVGPASAAAAAPPSPSAAMPPPSAAMPPPSAAMPPPSAAMPPLSVAQAPGSVAVPQQPDSASPMCAAPATTTPPSVPMPFAPVSAVAPTAPPMSTAWPQPASGPTAAVSSPHKSGAGRKAFTLLSIVVLLGGLGVGGWWVVDHYDLLEGADKAAVASGPDKAPRSTKDGPKPSQALTVRARATAVDQLGASQLEAHILTAGWSTRGRAHTDRQKGATVTVVRAQDDGASATFELHRYGSSAGAAEATPAQPIQGRPYAVARGHRQVLFVALSRGDAARLLRRLLQTVTPSRPGSPTTPGDDPARQDPPAAASAAGTTRPPVATRQPPPPKPSTAARPSTVGPSKAKPHKPAVGTHAAAPRAH